MEEKSGFDQGTGLEIAVIGMSGRFPGAGNLQEFWENLKNGVESLVPITDEDLEKSGINPELYSNPSWVRVRASMDNIEYFDSAFFGYTPKEAEIMNPQMRIFHEVAWEALEDSGYDPRTYKGLIGLFAGSTTSVQWEAGIELTGKSVDIGSLATQQLCDKDYLGTRTAYNFNLKGPVVMVQSACSTSLVAAHLACQAILNGECHMALAGGISVLLGVTSGYFYVEGSILSKDGHCRVFDADANGTVFGNGVGVVVLKALEEAMTDGDTIRAVIKGTAVDNDGSNKAAFPAPAVEGQVRVIHMAHQVAEVDPATITYVETHGTGTMLGDPIEIEALKKAFNTDKKGYCAIGSAKSNVGHLDAAAGITGLIKTILALRHRHIPPSLNFSTPNPKIDFENCPFFVNTKLREWTNGKYPLRAGVSAFGVGGTNAHAVLQEAPMMAPSSEARRWKLILISAKTSKSLDGNCDRLASYFAENPDINLTDAAFTFQVGRRVLERKRMLVCGSAEEAVEILRTRDPERMKSFAARDQRRPVIFMFSGQGSQYVNMGLDIYHHEPSFQEEVGRCFEILKTAHGVDLQSILFPGELTDDRQEELSQEIKQTEISQLVIFTIEYALARLLMKWGIEPYAMIGHSIGEYVAATLSGVLSLEDALRVVLARGKLMQRMPTGSMLSVPLPEEALIPLLPEDLEMAAVNSSSLCVVSGTHEAIEKFARHLSGEGIDSTRLHTSHAFHSRMMEPMLEKFSGEVGKVTLNKPQIPYISNVTGTWIGVDEATDPAYWARHIRQTVRFNDGLTELLQQEHGIFVEVGPGKALATFVRQHKDKVATQFIVNLVRHPKDRAADDRFLLEKMGELWLYGQSIKWENYYDGQKRHRLPLPTYFFDSQPNWIEQNMFTYMGAETIEFRNFQLGNVSPVSPQLPQKKTDVADWFYVPTWKPVGLDAAENAAAGKGKWLVFANNGKICSQLMSELERWGGTIVTVTAGDGFAGDESSGYVINPGKSEDYDALLEELKKSGGVPDRVAHLWNVSDDDQPPLALDGLQQSQFLGFYSLVFLVQALGKVGVDGKCRLAVVSTNMQEVVGGDLQRPTQATMLGPVRLIPREYGDVYCKSIDIDTADCDGSLEQDLVRKLAAELTVETADLVVAYRDGQRWAQSFDPRRLEKKEQPAPRFKQGAVYLVTGGLGGIGLELAKDLAPKIQPKLILTGRSPLPPRQDWQMWIEEHDGEDPTIIKIRAIQEIEKLGAQVMAVDVDVSDLDQMKNMVDRAQARFGPINGVIHSAGVADGGLIQLRTHENLESVLRPKVNGALVLYHIFKEASLDFLVLFSSVISVSPPIGQVGYCAANAFLDAFAHHRTAPGSFTISINWDAWQQVGMAVNAMKKMMNDASSPAPLPKEEMAHPLFDYRTGEPRGGEVSVSTFTADCSWVLDEHRILVGKASLPGTGFLEMIRAAFAHHLDEGTVMEIGDVNFMKPLILEKGEKREVQTVFQESDGYFPVEVRSRSLTVKGDWEIHARAEAAVMAAGEPVKYDIEAIRKSCAEGERLDIAGTTEIFNNPDLFGPRWQNCLWILPGKGEWLARLELPDAYAGDMKSYTLHPALLDVAVGIAAFVPEVFNGQTFLPFSYKRIKIHKPLPGKIFSHVKYAGDEGDPDDVKVFDIVLMDTEGERLVEIEGYTFRKVGMETRPIPENIPAIEDVENFSLEISQFGDLDTLAFSPIDRKSPGPGEVEYEVMTSALNFKDILFALGVLPVPPDQEMRLGLESTGKIVAVGEGVTDLKKGDEVLALISGSFREYVTMPTNLITPIPKGLSPEEAVTLPMPYMTAYYSLIQKAELGKGERVLIHSAAGGVGMAAVNVARWAGAEIFATAGTEEKREYLKSLGIQYVMDSRSLDFADQVMEYTNGEGVDVVLNALAGEFIPKNLSLLRQYGRFLELGVKDINNDYKLGLRPFMNALTYYAIVMTSEIPNIIQTWKRVVELFNNREFPPLPYKVFPSTQVSGAFKYMLQGEHIGKIVMTMSDKDKLTLRKIDPKSRKLAPQAARGEDAVPLYARDSYTTFKSQGAAVPDTTPGGTPFQEYKIEDGILPSQGVDIFGRVMWESLPQVVVSTRDIRYREQAGPAETSGASLMGGFAGSPSSGEVRQRPDLLTEYVAPRDEIEEGLVEILRNLLGIEAGVNDDFFELGGDSLKASGLVNKIKSKFDINIPVSEIFIKKNIVGIAQLVKEAKGDTSIAEQILQEVEAMAPPSE